MKLKGGERDKFYRFNVKGGVDGGPTECADSICIIAICCFINWFSGFQNERA